MRVETRRIGADHRQQHAAAAGVSAAWDGGGVASGDHDRERYDGEQRSVTPENSAAI